MRRPSLALLSAIVFTAMHDPSFAQRTGSGKSDAMTLLQVIETADTGYPAIKAAQAHQRAAEGAISIAKTAYLPRTDVLWQTNRATAQYSRPAIAAGNNPQRYGDDFAVRPDPQRMEQRRRSPAELAAP